MLGFLRGQWAQLQAYELRPNWALLVFSQVLFTAGLALLPYGSWRILRGMEIEMGKSAVWRMFFLGQMAKYLPGSLWAIPSRAFLYHQQGASTAQSLEAVYWESGLGVVGAALVMLLGLPLLLGSVYLWVVGGVVGGFALVFVAGNLVLWRWQPPMRLLKLRITLHPRHLPPIILFYALDWLLIGLSFAALAAAFDPTLSAGGWLGLPGLFAGAWAVSFLAIFAPGGIGVREAVLTLGAGALLDEPLPLVVAIAARLAWTGADIIGFVLFSLVRR